MSRRSVGARSCSRPSRTGSRSGDVGRVAGSSRPAIAAGSTDLRRWVVQELVDRSGRRARGVGGRDRGRNEWQAGRGGAGSDDAGSAVAGCGRPARRESPRRPLTVTTREVRAYYVRNATAIDGRRHAGSGTSWPRTRSRRATSIRGSAEGDDMASSRGSSPSMRAAAVEGGDTRGRPARRADRSARGRVVRVPRSARSWDRSGPSTAGTSRGWRP